MKRILSQNNPFGYTPKGLAFELMRDLPKLGYHLDYGTYNGAFPRALKRANLVDAALGIDVNAEVVNAHRKDMPAAVDIGVIKKNEPLEFAPGTFDSISILGVLEHVHDQARLLSQLEKALKADGTMLIAVPGQHLSRGSTWETLSSAFRASIAGSTWRGIRARNTSSDMSSAGTASLAISRSRKCGTSISP